MKVNKTIKEINEKIANKKAVVLTAEEMSELVEEIGLEKAAQKVDIVTTGTFGCMCSSGVLLNIGHAQPRIKLNEAYLNGVPAYAGLAAVDIYLGATALPEDDPKNEVYPGTFDYGGGHVIEELVAGKDIEFEGYGYGTDCYPRREIKKVINKKNIPYGVFLAPRNAYQNYLAAVNRYKNRTIYTYMGMLKPNLGNLNYSTSGPLSPLFNDPFYETIGIGTKIFLGGGIGYISFHGTQHNPFVERTERGLPKYPAGTLMVVGDIKNMSDEFIKGASILGYGVSLFVGIGIPIPILNERIAFWTSVKAKDILMPVVDFSKDYPSGEAIKPLAFVNYENLQKGEVEILGKKVKTYPVASYKKAREIANILKNWIESGKFFLTEPVAKLPGPDIPPKFTLEFMEKLLRFGGK